MFGLAEAGEGFRGWFEKVHPLEAAAVVDALGVHELEYPGEVPGGEDGVGWQAMADAKVIDYGEDAGAGGGDFPKDSLSTAAAMADSMRAMTSGFRASISSSFSR